MINMSKKELFDALQKSSLKYENLCKQIASLNMKVPESRILVLELPPLIRDEKLHMKSLRYYYRHYDKIHANEKQEEKN